MPSHPAFHSGSMSGEVYLSVFFCTHVPTHSSSSPLSNNCQSMMAEKYSMMTVLPYFHLGKVHFHDWCSFSGTDLELDVMASLVLGEASGLVWADGINDKVNSRGSVDNWPGW